MARLAPGPGAHRRLPAARLLAGRQEHLLAGQRAMSGERRWPMALAVLAAGGLRAALPSQLRNGDTRWAFVVVLVVLLGVLILGDPGRIDRDSTWLRVLTGTLIGLI